MRHYLISRLTCLTALLASILLATGTFAQRLPECENTPELKTPPEYPSTLCQEFNELPQPIPIVLGIPGWMTDADVNLQLGTTVLTNKVVYVQGDFTVLANFEFNNCWVSISPGKKIKVGNNSIVAEPLLNVNNSRLFCCNGLWNGIDMEDGARVNTSNGSRIEDATTAIIADGNNFTNTLSLQNTTFNRNRIGVQIGKTSTGTGTSVAVVNFSDNVFSCTSPLNTTLSEITFAGVLVQRISGLTTLNSVAITEFREIMFGVYVGNHINTVTLGQTFLNIQGLKFNRIINKGIFMEPAVVANILSCEFINNGTHGIDILKSDQLQVLGCKFTYTDDVIPNGKNFYYGVRFNPNGSNIVFNDQNITSNVFDIDFLDASKIERIHCISMYGASDGSDGEHYIDNNTFYMNFQQVAGIPAETRAITVAGGIHPNTENSVLENYCEFKNFSSNFASSCVINITNGDYNNLFVSNNTFKGFEFDYEKNGETAIRLAGSSGDEVFVVSNFFNGVTGNPELAIPFDIGIFVADFENTDFQYNFLRENDAGFIFHGTNENTNMLCNDIIGGNELLKLDFSIIGPQGGPLAPNGIPLSVNGNEWFNVETPAFDANCTPPSFASFSPFFVTGQQSPTNTFFPDMINPSSGWFTGDGPESECVFALTQNPLERSIADGTLATALDNPADAWETERYLYKRLINDAALLNSWSGFQTFKSAKDGSAMAQLSAVQQMIADAYAPSPSLAAQVVQKKGEIDALLEDVEQLDAQIANGESTALMTQRKQKQTDLAVKQGEAAAIDAAYQAEVTNKLQAAQTANNAITTTAVYEQHTKLVNGFIIELALNGALSEGQISTLKSIAAQCPRDGGMAVYQARGILPDCELENIDESICRPSQGRSAKPIAAQVTDNVRIVPNPNQGAFLIQADNLAGARVMVYDVLGNVVVEQRIVAETTAFRFSHDLNAGTYFCRIVGIDGQNRTVSFVVTR
jgi:hypothetical protein